MHVIDINASFGKRVEVDPLFSPAGVSETLRRHRVARAFVYSQQCVDYSAVHGNSAMLAAVTAHPALLPVWGTNPRETKGWREELSRGLGAGVRAFRFFPGVQGWPVASARFREMLDYLRGSRAVIIVSSQDCPTGWEIAGPLAEMTAAAGLPLILTDTAYRNQTEIIAVMQRHRHVYADTRWVATSDGVEYFAGQVGADRLLYGSLAPYLPMQKALNQVLEADLSDADKQAILSGNAMRLFDIAPESLDGAPQLESLEPAQFGEEIIDVHAHLGFWALPMHNDDYDPAGMIRRMRRFGITRSVVSSYESMRYDVAAGNRLVMQAIEGHPELLGYVELDPHHLELSCAEMDRYYALPNVAGCEVELSHIPCPTGSLKVRRLAAEIAKRGKPVLFLPHGDDAAVERELARDNPELKLVHAHGFNEDWARVVQDTPNICVEYCLSRASHFDVRAGLDLLGPQRVLFGTDQTLLSVGGAVGLYLDADMTAEERALVLSGNARRLYGI